MAAMCCLTLPAANVDHCFDQFDCKVQQSCYTSEVLAKLHAVAGGSPEGAISQLGRYEVTMLQGQGQDMAKAKAHAEWPLPLPVLALASPELVLAEAQKRPPLMAHAHFEHTNLMQCITRQWSC